MSFERGLLYGRRLGLAPDLENFEPNPYMPDDDNYQISHEHFFDYDQRKTELHSNCSFDLSHLPEPRRYLKVIPSDKKGDDSILLETTNGKECCVRLKELEMNDNGEFIMTLKPIKTNLFLEQHLGNMPNLKLEQGSVTNSDTNSNGNKIKSNLNENQVGNCDCEPIDLTTLDELALEQEAATLEKDEYLEKFLEFVKKDKRIV